MQTVVTAKPSERTRDQKQQGKVLGEKEGRCMGERKGRCLRRRKGKVLEEKEGKGNAIRVYILCAKHDGTFSPNKQTAGPTFDWQLKTHQLWLLTDL